MTDVLLPILKDTKDPHYRYKMPKLTAKVEGSGNGIKTVITNMVAIAKSLGRPPAYPTKYFGCELGAQVTMNNEIYVVNGSHDETKLINLLYGFIRKFVLCQKCNNPETSLSVSNQTIRQKCIACGHDTTINKAIHKLTTYIINNPPDNVKGGTVSEPKTKSSTKSAKSEKKSSKKQNGGSGSADGTGSNSPTNNGNGTQLIDSGNDVNQPEGDFDDFDEKELTTDEYQKRMREICDGFSSGMYMSDMTKKESCIHFQKRVKEKKDAGQLLETSVQKELFDEAKRLDIKDKAALILADLLLTENVMNEIKKYKMLFLRFCVENKKAQKYLLGGYEKLVGDIYKEKLFANAVKVLKLFYDEEILDEDVIIEWSLKDSKKYVSKEMSKKIHDKVAPFIQWLKEAEVEDSDEDEEEEEEDEDDDDEADESDESNTKKKKPNGTKKQREESVESDDVDIDFSYKATDGIREQPSKPVVVMPVNADLAENKNGVISQDDIDIDNI